MPNAVENQIRQQLKCPDCNKVLGEYSQLSGVLWRNCPRCKEEKRWEFPLIEVVKGDNYAEVYAKT